MLLTNRRGGVEYNFVETYIFYFWIQFSCDCDSVEGQKLVFLGFQICALQNWKTQPLHRKIRGYSKRIRTNCRERKLANPNSGIGVIRGINAFVQHGALWASFVVFAGLCFHMLSQRNTRSSEWTVWSVSISVDFFPFGMSL